nr:MAG TPA: Nucleoside 2-deoxyribosyltransferase [Caudoviricetes sp.]
MKVYIAGKITGNERYREEFAAAERKVRAMGHIPLNPAALPEGMEPADYMRICMAMLDSADAIAIMKNWTESTGARIEFAYAQYVNKKVLNLWLMPDFSPKKDVEPEMDVSSERLEELAAADRDGRLVVLPCKVGDTVWYEEYGIANGKLIKYGIQPHVVLTHFEYMVTKGKLRDKQLPLGGLGINWFLTREEAEKALEAMQDE